MGFTSEEAELLQLVRISGEDCGVVHCLSQAQHPGMSGGTGAISWAERRAPLCVSNQRVAGTQEGMVVTALSGRP